MLAAAFRFWHGHMPFTITIMIMITLTRKRLRGIAALRIETSDDGEDVLDVTDHGSCPSFDARSTSS